MSEDLQRARRVPQKIDRLPPSSMEAEQGVLGCAMLTPQECLGECVERLRMGTSAFYDLRHQTIYEALVGMWDKQEHIDLVTLQDNLRDAGKMERVGGLAYLASLPDSVHSSAALPYYLDIVVEKFTMRKLIQTCTSVVGRVFEHDGDLDELLDGVEKDIFDISQGRLDGGMPDTPKLVGQAIGLMEEYWKSGGKPMGIQTGIVDFDKQTTGLHPGDMCVIAARPSVGKTSLAMNIVEHVAVEQKIPTAVFTLEMTGLQLMVRMLCSRSRKDIRSVQNGFFTENDFSKMAGAAKKISAAPLYIDDTTGLTVLQLKAKARRIKQQHGIRLFVIDYMQLLTGASRKSENRQQEVAEISRGIKGLAKELGVPVIVLSQLNREVEKRDGDKPRLSDLRESGAIEQDADLVGLLYRVKVNKEGEDDETEQQDAIPVNLYVGKQRNGPIGDIHLVFIKSLTRFYSASKVETSDIPDQASQREIPTYDTD